ncbi:MAG TPA: hypothetical protein GXX59_08860 [Syntrophomonadaceae bacterium]|nr:hypothetical protein [Syntrophomonadaceae bacterium]
MSANSEVTFHNNEYFTDRGSCSKENPLLLEEEVFPLSRDLPPLWHPIERELRVVFKKLEATLRPEGRSLLKQLMQPLDYEFLLPPGMVLFSGHLFSKRGDQHLPAIFMELTYLGTKFLNLAGQLSCKEQQMFVLTGDYLCSHLFHLIYESENIFLLEKFSALITTMNEGFSRQEGYRLKRTEPGKNEIKEYLYKQYGVFYGESCALGGVFAGSSKKEQLLLKEFGTAFGIAYGVHKKGYSCLSADEFLEEGFQALSLLPNSLSRRELEFFARRVILNSCSV